MKILNLFLIFIQFALCYGVDLLEDPGDLPDNELTQTLPQIEGLNDKVITEMNVLSTDVLDKIKHDDNVRDFVIIENLEPRNRNKAWKQYKQFSEARDTLQKKFNFINGINTKTNLKLGLGRNSQNELIYDLKNKNIQMQNILIEAMNKISDYVYSEVNDVAQEQELRGHSHVQGFNGQEGYEHGASGSGGYVPVGYGQGSYGHGGYGHVSHGPGGVYGHVQQGGQSHGQGGPEQGFHEQSNWGHGYGQGNWGGPGGY